MDVRTDCTDGMFFDSDSDDKNLVKSESPDAKLMVSEDLSFDTKFSSDNNKNFMKSESPDRQSSESDSPDSWSQKHNSSVDPDTTRTSAKHMLELASQSLKDQVPLPQFAQDLQITTKCDLRKSKSAPGLKTGATKEHSDKPRTVFAMRCLLMIAECPANGSELDDRALKRLAVPRSVVYRCYAYFCRACDTPPFAVSVLGRLTRVCWPNAVAKRLGTRGNSKYHYCGVVLKPGIDKMIEQLSSSENEPFRFRGVPQLYMTVSRQIMDIEPEYHESDPAPFQYLSTITPRLRFPVLHSIKASDFLFSANEAAQYHLLFQKDSQIRILKILLLKGDYQHFLDLLISQNPAHSELFELAVYFNLLKNLQLLTVTGMNEEFVRILRHFIVGCNERGEALMRSLDSSCTQARVRHLKIFCQLLEYLIGCANTAKSVSKLLLVDKVLENIIVVWDNLSHMSNGVRNVFSNVYTDASMLGADGEWEELFCTTFPKFLRKTLDEVREFSDPKNDGTLEITEQESLKSASSMKSVGSDGDAMRRRVLNLKRIQEEVQGLRSASDTTTDYVAQLENEQDLFGETDVFMQKIEAESQFLMQNLGISGLVDSDTKPLQVHVMRELVSFVLGDLMSLFSGLPTKMSMVLVSHVFNKIFHELTVCDCDSTLVHERDQTFFRYSLVQLFRFKTYIDEFLKFHCEMYGLEVAIREMREKCQVDCSRIDLLMI